MFLIIKDIAGCNYKIPNKTITLKGGCFLNEISKQDFNDLLNVYPNLSNAIDSGFIIVSEKDNKAEVQRAVDETLQKTKDKQDKKIQLNEKSNRVKISKE